MNGYDAIPWEITWSLHKDYRGERIATHMGPFVPDHDHWVGSHLSAGEVEVLLAAQAPVMRAALIEVLHFLVRDQISMPHDRDRILMAGKIHDLLLKAGPGDRSVPRT